MKQNHMSEDLGSPTARQSGKSLGTGVLCKPLCHHRAILYGGGDTCGPPSRAAERSGWISEGRTVLCFEFCASNSHAWTW